MSLPPDARRLAAITDYISWRRALERFLIGLDHRIAGIVRADVGQIVVWATATPPAGYVVADGSLVNVADHLDLYARIGTTYNTGGETPGVTFRVPNMGATGTPPSVWAIRG